MTQAPATTDNAELRTRVEDGTAVVELDRPRAINALTVAMVERLAELVAGWQDDDAVQRIELRGLGERGFCSGADVRAIRQLVLDAPEQAVDFFRTEYALDLAIATSAKPVTSHLFGVSMGGGLGLALHAQQVVAAPDLRLAMPEVGIGLFPDVGVTHQLSRLPNEVGTWLAMTGAEITASEALWLGLVDRVEQPGDGEPAAGGGGWLSQNAAWIEECFAGDDPVAIVRRLEENEEPEARECADLIRTRSPWSVAVALEAVRRAASKDLAQVLEQDMALARNFVADSDFVEGVRAQLVDKDKDPHWRHARLEDVPRDLVESMFR